MATLTPIKAIRAKCIDCCGGQKAEVRLCPCTDCTLHPYRMGRRPKAEAPEPFNIDDIEEVNLEDFKSPEIDFDDIDLEFTL